MQTTLTRLNLQRNLKNAGAAARIYKTIHGQNNSSPKADQSSAYLSVAMNASSMIFQSILQMLQRPRKAKHSFSQAQPNSSRRTFIGRTLLLPTYPSNARRSMRIIKNAISGIEPVQTSRRAESDLMQSETNAEDATIIGSWNSQRLLFPLKGVGVWQQWTIKTSHTTVGPQVINCNIRFAKLYTDDKLLIALTILEHFTDDRSN